MIARHETHTEKVDIWAQLAAPLPASGIQWRIDSKPVARDGGYVARFVAYVDAQFVRERLDTVVPGEWDLTLELLPRIAEAAEPFAFKARLQILGVIREDVGVGEDYKNASTDAFKRAGVRFGIAHELYAYGPNWVRVDGDSKFAKAIEDPQAVYERRRGAGGNGAPPAADRPDAATAMLKAAANATEPTREAANGAAPAAPAGDAPNCPKCGGRMWDNRLSKRNPKAPDYKCRDRTCDGVVWPPRDQKQDTPAVARARAELADEDYERLALGASTDDIDF